MINQTIMLIFSDTEEMTVISEYDMSSSLQPTERVHVTKTGIGTGTTTGYIKEMNYDCRIYHRNNQYYFQNCYGIVKEGNELFSIKGDSGSAVFVVNNGVLKPLGILFIYGPITAVCKIDEIIEERRLRIVRIKD